MPNTRKTNGIAAKFIPKYFEPSAEQLAIQTATDRMILVDANAGAAKTTTLSLRVAEALARGVRADEIIVLTVTSAAKSAFRDRLVDIGVPKQKVAAIRIQTFEELAIATLLTLESVEVPYVDDMDNLRQVAVDAMTDVSERYGNRYEIDASISNLAIHTFFKMQTRLKATLAIRRFQIDLDEHLQEDVESLLGVPFTTYLWHQQYERLRGALNGEPLFRGEHDAAYDLVMAMEDDSAARELLPAAKVVVCDELHDLNEVTFRLLTALIEHNKAEFCGAGDKDQVIFSWTGADHDILDSRFKQAFDATKVYPLTRCYRHGPSLAASVGAFKNKTNESGIGWDTGIDVLYYDKADSTACARKVLQAIRKWVSVRGDDETIGILLRNPAQSVSIEGILINAGMHYRTEAMPSFLQRTEILMFRGMLAAALGNIKTIQHRASREAVFDALALFSEIPIEGNLQANWESLRQEAISQPNAMTWFMKGTILRLATHSKAPIEHCLQYLAALPENTPAAAVLAYVSETMKIDEVVRRLYVDREEASSVRKSVLEFIELARNTKMDIFEFSRWLGEIELKFNLDKDNSHITIACADDIKGKEYDLAIIPYLEHHVFPRSTYDDLERRDESNRFYVAITRAKHHLVLLTPAEERDRSQYIYDMSIEQAKEEGKAILQTKTA